MTNKVRSYYCDTCDKSFKTDDDLIVHEAEHETCGQEGCKFTAHPKIVAKHIRFQHDTGLYKRIGKLYSTEDIFKWIEERKRRFPTKKVIEEKKAMEVEKANRGERLSKDKSLFNKLNEKRKERRPKNKTSRNKIMANRKPKQKPDKIDLVDSFERTDRRVNWRGNLQPFAGTGNMSGSESGNDETAEQFSDNEWEALDSTGTVSTTSAPAINSSLGLLASFYGSDSEEEESKINDSKPTVNAESDDEGSAPEEVKTISSKAVDCKGNGMEERSNSSKRKRKHGGSKKTNSDVCYDNRKRKFERRDVVPKQFSNVRARSLTLLEKLLSNEIRHERNVILQCVRHVVKNNFFDS